jgi:hypothetical protein
LTVRKRTPQAPRPNAYDPLNRLIGATTTQSAGGDYAQTYTYSAIGNITAKSDAGSYTYAGDQGSNYANPHAASSINGSTYTYDRNGNLTAAGTRVNSWDYQNRLTQSGNGTRRCRTRLRPSARCAKDDPVWKYLKNLALLQKFGRVA